MTHVGRDNPRIKDVNVGGILTASNPAEQRRLDGLLEQLEREKKKRLGNLEWNQRSFFIKQVFDHNNELRFVKASERPKYLEGFPPIDDENVGGEEEDAQALRDPQDENGTNPPPSSPTSDTHKDDLNSDLGNNFHINQSDEVRTNEVITLSPRDRREGMGTVEQVPVKIRESSSADSKSKVKFPVLKVRAMGLFAASAKKPERIPAESITLPRTPDTERKSPGTTKISPGSPNFTQQFAPSPPASPRVAFSKCSFTPDIRRQRHASARLSLDVSDLPSLSRARSGEDLFSSPAVIRRHRSKSKPNLPIKGNIWGKTMNQATSSESISDEECDERLIRKLVRTLPTHLLLKTRERETETGSGSAGIGEMKRRMLEKCRNDTNQRTVEDPRFKYLAQSLTEVPNSNDYSIW